MKRISQFDGRTIYVGDSDRTLKQEILGANVVRTLIDCGSVANF